MSGQSQQTQQAAQNTTQATGQNTTGTSQYGGNQTQSLTPWDQTAPLVGGIASSLTNMLPSTGLNPNQQTAVQQMLASAQAGNPFTSQLTGATSGLLAGGGANAQNQNINDVISQMQGYLPSVSNTLASQLAPIINQPLGTISPALQGMLNTARSDVTNQVNQEFAGAGRDMSGLNVQALGRGITAAQDPILANQYNTQIAQLLQGAGLQAQTGLNAANSLFTNSLQGYNALSGNNQNAISNILQGITTGAPAAMNALTYGPQATLAAGNLQQGIPQQNLQYLASLGLPLAQTFGTQTGATTGNAAQQGAQFTQQGGQGTTSGTTTSNPSALQQALGWSQIFGNLFGSKSGGAVGNAVGLFG
jgi:hypothetical protein